MIFINPIEIHFNKSKYFRLMLAKARKYANFHFNLNTQLIWWIYIVLRVIYWVIIYLLFSSPHKKKWINQILFCFISLESSASPSFFFWIRKILIFLLRYFTVSNRVDNNILKLELKSFFWWNNYLSETEILA